MQDAKTYDAENFTYQLVPKTIPVRYLIYLLAASLPFYSFALLQFGSRALTLSRLIVVVLLVAFTLDVLRGSVYRLKANNFLKLAMLLNVFLLLSGLEPFLSGNFARIEDFMTTWVLYFGYSLAFIVVCNMRLSLPTVRYSLRIYIGIAVVLALFGIIQTLAFKFAGTDLYFEFAGSGYETLLAGMRRATSVFAEPRHLGAFLVGPFLVLSYTLLSRFTFTIFRSRWITLFSFALVSIGIVFALAFSTFLSLSVIAVLCGIVFGISFRKLIIGSAFAGSLWAIAEAVVQRVVGVSFTNYVVYERFLNDFRQMSRFWDFDLYAVSPIRYLRGMYLSLDYSVSHPFGIGLNQFYTVSEGKVLILPPFDLLASIGLIGFAVFVMFILTLLRNMWTLKARVREQSVEAASWLNVGLLLTLGAIVPSLFGSRISYTSVTFWFLLMLAGTIYLRVREGYLTKVTTNTAASEEQA